jgi:hypothetical protein
MLIQQGPDEQLNTS